MPIIQRRYSLIIFALLAILGILIARRYGESWDELKFFKYADSALSAYTTWPMQGTIAIFGNTYDNYGPAYVMLVALLARGLQFILPWSISDLRHLLYFFTFLPGIWAFHALARRWLTQNAAIFGTALFATQPLFWGHAFISPKDIPFLTFILLSLLFGLRLVDTLQPLSLNGLSPRLKQTLLVLTALWLASVIGLFATVQLVHAWIDGLVRAAASGEMNIVSRIASDIHKVDPEVYIQRYFVFFLWARLTFFLLFSFIVIYLYRRYSPSIFSCMIPILFPAILMGFTTSIRILGPFVALFITVYALRRHGRQTILPLAVYALVAIIAMYLTWPYLWLDPIGNFIESLRVMSQYPWRGQVLFNGIQYSSTNLPYSYLPVLLGIQLTEPVWFLFLAGLAVAIVGSIKKRTQSQVLLALALVWFMIPLTGFIITRSPLYDNFRQIFFILPPVFFLAGAALEKIKRPALQIGLMILFVLPGVMDGLRLHPYEYIYYNRFAGGVDGAFRKFELDYWGTSYREAANWLNENAPDHAFIWTDGPAHLLGLYLRKDLQMYSSYESDRADHYDYVVTTTRYNLDLTSYPDAKIVHVVERGGALLTLIKQP